MSEEFCLDVQTRPEKQTNGELRQMRMVGRVPAILYGKEGGQKRISVCEKKLRKHLENKAFCTAVFNVELDGTVERVHPRDVQYHKLNNGPIHLDLMRV